MSRTDKDAPYWVRAEWWEPWHQQCENQAYSRSIGGFYVPRRKCDLPLQPDVKQYGKFTFRHRRCFWRPIWDRLHYPNPPRWYRNHVWTAPQRLQARMQCREAAKQYRGSGDTDVVVTTDQNRHCAAWLWN